LLFKVLAQIGNAFSSLKQGISKKSLVIIITN
jgi:hypothetical protein